MLETLRAPATTKSAPVVEKAVASGHSMVVALSAAGNASAAPPFCSVQADCAVPATHTMYALRYWSTDSRVEPSPLSAT